MESERKARLTLANGSGDLDGQTDLETITIKWCSR